MYYKKLYCIYVNIKSQLNIKDKEIILNLQTNVII